MRVLAALVLASGVLLVQAALAQDATVAPPVATAPDTATPATVEPAPSVVTTAPDTDHSVAPLAPAPKPRIARQEPDADADPVPLDDAAFDAGFQCPQSYDSAESRMDEVARYFAWARLRHPDWSFRKKLDVRYGLLRRHACAVTLANLGSSARPPFAR